jgi:hypothetical protein
LRLFSSSKSAVGVAVSRKAVPFGPTPRPADTASPQARRGGLSGKVGFLREGAGRHRRAADAHVSHFMEMLQLEETWHSTCLLGEKFTIGGATTL